MKNGGLMMEGLFLIFLIFVFINFIKTVPANTVIIVDRNSHYLKTKRRGFYFFNPATDKVTTKISTYQLSKSYMENFETHDGKIVRVSFSVRYHAENLEDVLAALASARRSIDDVMNGSIYWSVNNLSLSDFIHTPIVLSSEAKPKLLSEATELKIKIDEFHINNIAELPATLNVVPFKPHLSTHSSGPIRFN